MPWFIFKDKKNKNLPVLNRTVAQLDDFFEIPDICPKKFLRQYTPTFKPDYYLKYSNAGIYHLNTEAFGTVQNITLTVGRVSKTCSFNLTILCALNSYACCDKKYKFCAANVKRLGKIDITKQFYAPFGCTWRNTKTWTYMVNPDIATATYNRVDRHAYLTVT
jgi:hypothetical protein